MKKILIVILIILFVCVGILVAIPLFFKQKVFDITQNTINKNINAKVEFADIKLSLFRNFPNATAELTELTIIGKQAFGNDTLLYAPSVRASMDLTSLFGNTGMRIHEISFSDTRLNLLVNPEGEANWDIANNNTAENPNADGDGLKLQLDKITITNSSLLYEDRTANMLVQLSGMHFNSVGSMYGAATQLETEGNVQELIVQQNGVNYISKTTLDVRTLLDVDLDKMKFTIAENELMVNRLPLQLSGFVEMPADTTFMNLQLSTSVADFENFLALVPPVYAGYLKDVETSGEASISGNITGYYFDEDYPQFELKTEISGGNFHYADLPEQIKNIKAQMLVSKPQGELDLAKVEVNNAHAEIRNNPVNGSLRISNPVSDPYFDGAFSGKINLSDLKAALPMDSIDVAGIIDARLMVKGRYSAIEQEAYDKIKSDGEINLSNFLFQSVSLTQAISIPSGKLDFSPKNMNLKNFQMKIGRSDFLLTGVVSDYLSYLLQDGTLKGNLQLNSRFVDFNEMLRLQVAGEELPDKK